MFLQNLSISESVKFLSFLALESFWASRCSLAHVFRDPILTEKRLFLLIAPIVWFFTVGSSAPAPIVWFFTVGLSALQTRPRGMRGGPLLLFVGPEGCRESSSASDLPRPTSDVRLPTPYYRLPRSSFLLPTSCFLLPASHFPLPCFLLRASHFPLLRVAGVPPQASSIRPPLGAVFERTSIRSD